MLKAVFAQIQISETTLSKNIDDLGTAISIKGMLHNMLLYRKKKARSELWCLNLLENRSNHYNSVRTFFAR